MSIRIGILGYGNLGRGVECAIKHNPDLELVAVFTRRAPETVKILTETATVYYSICPESITGDERRSYIAIRSSESCIREFRNESFSTEDHISCNESFRKQFFI